MGVYGTFWMCMDEQQMGANCDNLHCWPSNDPEERPPLVYGHSGIMPRADGERAGFAEVGSVYADLCGEGPTEENGYYEPFLRLGVGETLYGNGQTVVLDEEQIRSLHDALGRWLRARAFEFSGRRDEGGDA